MPASPSLSRQSKHLIAEFARQPDATRRDAKALRRTVSGSPELVDRLNRSVAAGELRALTALPIGEHAGGTYDGDARAISLPVAALRADARAEVAFVLGHEVQHALNRATTQRAVGDLMVNAGNAAQTDHDYTRSVAQLLAVRRWDEASSNLGGWNALADHLRDGHGNVTLADMAAASERASDFIDSDPFTGELTARPGLQINGDVSIDLSPENVAAMGSYYFDKGPRQSALGHHGNSDYVNYYGAHAVGIAAEIHEAHHQDAAGTTTTPMRIDLAGLDLSRQLMEQNGVRLGPGQRPVPYIDPSAWPPDVGHFHHTRETHTYVPSRPPVRDGPDTGSRSPARGGSEASLARMSFIHPPPSAAPNQTAAPVAARNKPPVPDRTTAVGADHCP